MSDLIHVQSAIVDHHVLSLLSGDPFFDVGSNRFHSLDFSRRFVPPNSVARLRHHVKRLRPDLIHAWLYHGNFVSMFAAALGVPILWSIHNTELSAQQSKLMTRAIRRLGATLSSWIPERILYCSESAREVHEQIGYQKTRGLVIENGIEFGQFRFDPDVRTRVRQALGLADPEFAVGCIARFDPQKNHRLVIDAFSRLARRIDAKLILIGQGCTESNAELLGWLEQSGMLTRTHLLGARHDVGALMSALDVLVIGSSFGEALPVVAIEAAAASLPIVATDVGDIASLVEDPADVVPIDAPEAMAAAIENIRGRARSKLRSGRTATLDRFSITRMARDYLRLYESLGRFNRAPGGSPGR